MELENAIADIKKQKNTLSKKEIESMMMSLKAQQNEIYALLEEVKKIEIAVSSLPNKKYSKVLRLRYLEFKTWMEVKHEFGYSWESVRNLHIRALTQYKNLKKLNCKFMNTPIEIISPHLWAIEFKHIECNSIHEEIGRITEDGILILNKNYTDYPLLIKWIAKIKNKSIKQLQNEIAAKSKRKNKNPYQLLYITILKMEVERKEKHLAFRKEWYS